MIEPQCVPQFVCGDSSGVHVVRVPGDADRRCANLAVLRRRETGVESGPVFGCWFDRNDAWTWTNAQFFVNHQSAPQKQIDARALVPNVDRFTEYGLPSRNVWMD